MNETTKTALIHRLTALADDELILAHRDSEWTGHGPILEEDIALSNIAQDELGHATTIYGLIEDLTGQTPDQLAFFREAGDFCNVQMVEWPRGDWAFTMLRQYLFDAYEHVLIEALLQSAYQPLADVMAKFRGEEMYHLRHTHAWVERLGLGTEESNGRIQTALNELWPMCDQLFTPMPQEHLLVTEGIFPEVETLKGKWLAIVQPHLTNSQLQITNSQLPTIGRHVHSDHLVELLTDFQQVARWDPEAEW